MGSLATRKAEEVVSHACRVEGPAVAAARLGQTDGHSFVMLAVSLAVHHTALFPVDTLCPIAGHKPTLWIFGKLARQQRSIGQEATARWVCTTFNLQLIHRDGVGRDVRCWPEHSALHPTFAKKLEAHACVYPTIVHAEIPSENADTVPTEPGGDAPLLVVKRQFGANQGNL